MRLVAIHLFLICSYSAQGQADQLVKFNSAAIQYEGRIRFRPNAAELSWPGSTVQITFMGAELSATLKDLDTANYYKVIVDGIPSIRIHTDTVMRKYKLASNLPPGKHVVQLFKLTEWDKGKTLFYCFELPKASILYPSAPKKRKIEFYGNSITCGWGIGDKRGRDSGAGFFEDNYLTYAAITARHFDAQYSCIAKSGIGVLISWFPLVMGELYHRLDPTDSLSPWDFSKFKPDVVVIDLFQNDYSLTQLPEHPEYKRHFGTTPPTNDKFISAYKGLVSGIRNQYPKAFIICTLGNMSAAKENLPWQGYVRQAVSQLNDSRINTLFFPFKGTGGHPSEKEQAEMAKSLIEFIEKNISW